ncbi:MAG: LysR family transcriptional regulator [Clostridia bacterium]|nr:LysR family transcriptional regulator [Clostridia bacterium]
MNDLRNYLAMYYDFYVVAKESSIAQAAENHYLSQSNLSRTIKNLEEALELKLLIKTNKGIKLTLDGERLYKQLDEMFSNFNNNLDETTGKLVIGTTRNIADYKLINYLSDFNKKYPRVNVKIVTDSASNLNEYLVKHRIDVLIDYLPHINSTEKYEFETKFIEQFKTCFACTKELIANNKIKSLQDLGDFNLVIPGSSRRRQILDEVLQKNNIELNPIIEMPDSKLMIDFVKMNNYIGYFIEDEIKDTDLVKINLKEEMPINSIGIIYHKRTMNDTTKKFVELVLEKSNI